METNLSLETIVRRVTEEVMRELARNGMPASPAGSNSGLSTGVRLDMSRYKTPIVTENALTRLHERAVTVIVPAGAVITPRAKEVLRERNISVVFE